MYNTEFINHFIVYNNNSDVASSIITDTMMKRMALFKNPVERDIGFSFVNRIFYAAIAIKVDLLDSSLQDPKSKEKMKEYFFSMLLTLSLINQLDLRSLKRND